MADSQRKDLRVMMPMYIGNIFCAVAIVIFILGGYMFHEERVKRANYTEDVCLVLGHGYRNHTCKTKYASYFCFSAAWDVRPNKTPFINATAESVKKHRSIEDALAKTPEYQLNTRAPCWYDTRQPQIVQWNKPSLRVPRILLICGGLSVVMTIWLLLLSCYCSRDDDLGL